jgi:endogenous inhibitor of DNA gyrase (YacG/DUF329 family)
MKVVDPMSGIEKNKITELRQQGYGYKRIAKELSTTISAVRYACSVICDEDSLTGNCRNCGQKIKSIKGKKKKKFCSDNCRWQWWSKHLKEVNKKAYYTLHCKCCGKEFTAYGNNKRVYCSHDCYIKYKLQKGANHHEAL